MMSSVLQTILDTWWALPLLTVYVFVEFCFYLHFRYCMIPRANVRTPPAPYRAFAGADGKDRMMLLRRILDRIERTCRYTGHDILEVTAHYVAQWFRFHPSEPHHQPPPLCDVASENSSRSCSSLGDDDASESSEDDMKASVLRWVSSTLREDDVGDLLAWAFFGKHVEDLEGWEVKEQNRMFDHLTGQFHLSVKPGRSKCCTARRLTLENVDAMHRPLIVYIGVKIYRLATSAVLQYLLGFTRAVSQSGLVCYHRPATTKKGASNLPMLFFHGIAPGGSAIYLPMLLVGVVNDGREIYIFENRPVSYHFDFKAISEEDTVNGVQEHLESFGTEGDFAIMGHSFGTFQQTWLLHSKLRSRVRQMILLDPVSILLSEPDVITNFENATPLFRIVGTSELFVNYYIRRHFAWYRSELWLDDLPEDLQIFVGLAEDDQIVNGPKVKQECEVFAHGNESFRQRSRVQFWKGALHGDCLWQPAKWRHISDFLQNCTQKTKVQ